MSQKLASYSYDDDDDYVPMKKVKYDSSKDDIMIDKSHTLDSDEEDESKVYGKKYDILQDEDIDGQEDSTIDFEGETRITPFNMKEEMEEGHFDKEGFYHFKKNRELIKDAWLDNIDWIKIKHREGGPIEDAGSGNESSDSENRVKSKAEIESEKESEIKVYEEIIPLLKPHETVAAALKRLSGNKSKKRLSTSERWKLKKEGKLAPSGNENQMVDFMKLTEEANKLVEMGNMEIYEESYEMFALKIQRWKATHNASPVIPSVDIFADDGSTSSASGQQKEISSTASETLNGSNKNRLMWEYHWDDGEEDEIHGPFTTEQMLQWQDSNYFEKGARVRKVSEVEEGWYKASRIDFDLYM